ncbi:hypothetical protein MBLNU230_g5099t1 [Neophaeotheca triangularis]
MVDIEHALQMRFTKGMVESLRNKYPNMNVAIWHDQNTDPKTKGYEIYVFESGEFTRAGDGGFINWSYQGNCDTPNLVEHKHIVLPASTTQPTETTPIVPPPQPTRHASNTGDGNYLVNCESSSTGTISSGVAYYRHLDPNGGNVNRQPDDYVDVFHGSYTQ